MQRSSWGWRVGGRAFHRHSQKSSGWWENLSASSGERMIHQECKPQGKHFEKGETRGAKNSLGYINGQVSICNPVALCEFRLAADMHCSFCSQCQDTKCLRLIKLMTAYSCLTYLHPACLLQQRKESNIFPMTEASFTHASGHIRHRVVHSR